MLAFLELVPYSLYMYVYTKSHRLSSSLSCSFHICASELVRVQYGTVVREFTLVTPTVTGRPFKVSREVRLPESAVVLPTKLKIRTDM